MDFPKTSLFVEAVQACFWVHTGHICDRYLEMSFMLKAGEPWKGKLEKTCGLRWSLKLTAHPWAMGKPMATLKNGSFHVMLMHFCKWSNFSGICFWQLEMDVPWMCSGGQILGGQISCFFFLYCFFQTCLTVFAWFLQFCFNFIFLR